MPSYIIKLDDHYLIWSTVVDAPTAGPFTRPELDAYMTIERGEAYMRVEHQHRMQRVEATGTSEIGASLKDTVSWNRAGPKQTELNMDTLIDCCVRQPLAEREAYIGGMDAEREKK